jgi:predicted metal-dependent peptidase
VEEFAAEMAKLYTYCEETLILTSDAAIQQVVKTSEVPEFLRRLDFKGGGGTSHIPVFSWLREHRMQPDLLVALTDLASDFPEQKPSFPVIWCVKEGHAAGPGWGRIVVIPEKPETLARQ